MFTTNRVAALKTKSAKYVSVFREAASGLAFTNQEINKEQKIRDGRITVLQKENAELEVAKKENTKIIDNINSFFGITK